MPKQKIKLSINKKELSSLELFLKKHRANTEFTHTSITSPPASYFIDPKNIGLQNEFFDKYYEHIFTHKLPAHLTEGIRDCPITPVKIDIDFRYWQSKNNESKPKRIYTLEDIIKVCQLYMEKMEDWLVKPDPEERCCFILQKPNPEYDYEKKTKLPKENEKGEVRCKDGVHIMFPYLCTETELQLIFRDDVYKNCQPILDKFNFDNSYSDIFDKAVIDRNNWQMYGSSKKPNAQAYRVVKIVEIYKDSYKDISLENYNDKQLIRLLSVRNKDELSIIKFEKQNLLEDLKNKKTALAAKKKKYSKLGKKKKCSVPKEEREIIMEYVDCLALKRAQNYDTWIEVGWALHNIDNRSRKKGHKNCFLLEKWMDWGRQKGTEYENEPDTTYEDAWETMRDYGLGIGSLKLWAKEDNPEEYKKVLDKDLDPLIRKCAGKKGRGSSYDVAKVMYHMYKDDFICISIKDNIWYFYNKEEHRWIEDDKGINLKKKISVDVYQKFNNKASELVSMEAGDANGELKEKLWKVASRLKETSFKSNIMTECAELFYDFKHEFFEKLDSNLKLLGFNNGIYDLETGEFRSGRPEDYISMSTKIDYVEYNENAQEVRDIYKFMSQVLTNRNVREFVIKLMSSFLSGSTRSEKFHVWSGSGGNGKSKVIELLERSVGEYAGKMNISNLTQKRGASTAANPELARTKGKRFVNMQEPDEKTKLNVGLMKELTGGDKIIARALFKEPIEFKPQFKMVLTCNDKPELPPDDEGTWRRIILVEFNSKFRHDPNGEYINGEWIPESKKFPEFPIDETLNEKFDDWAEPFMSILIHVFMENKNKDIIEPKEVKEYTNKYREGQDHFQEFANDKIITVDEDSDNVKLILINNLFDEYKNWYKDNHGNNNHKKRSELKSFMDKKFNKYWVEGTTFSKRGWRGIKIIDSCNIDSDRDELDF